MSQQGFEDYLYNEYGNVTGTTNSYIRAIQIIDKMFVYEDVFALNGESVMCIDDSELLHRIADFICKQQTLYKKGNDSIFRNINSGQKSYPGNGFCSAAIRQLIKYQTFESISKEADKLVSDLSKGKRISTELISLFKINKKGSDKLVQTRTRIGQAYFRRMVLANYGNKCCMTGINVPVVLRASHIVRWADDKSNRMNPENGLCLSATYDAAFDKHLISFDDDYRMIVSKEIKDYYTNETTKEYFKKFEGKQIILPKKYMPSKKLLGKHRELLVG